jgi:AraC-like DNA-binding protein
MVRFQSSCLHTDRWHNAVHQLPDMLGDDLQQLLDLLTSGSETAAAAVLTEVLLLRLLLSAESSALERRRSDLPSDRPNAVATLESAQRFIQRNLDQPLTREQIAAACHCSGVHLARLTQRFFKCTPLELITEARMQQARELLSRDQRSISAIAGLVGYATASHFSQVFRKKHGLSPREFRRAGGRMWWQHKPNDGGPIYHHEANAVAEGTR